MEYYLPEGRWTHLLDGRVQEGGHWLRESYDFFSLPLWVRENTLLPWGGHDDRPDYDYLDGLAVRPFFVQPGTAFTVYDASAGPRRRSARPITMARPQSNAITISSF